MAVFLKSFLHVNASLAVYGFLYMCAFEAPLYGPAASAPLSLTLTDLTSNTTYYVGLYAVSAMGASAVAVLPTPGRTDAAAPPSAPASLACSNRTATSATLAWTMDDLGGTPLTGFRVYFEVGRVRMLWPPISPRGDIKWFGA